MKIQSNGVAIHVEQSGRGDLALVFLHYYGGSSRTWNAVAEQLRDRYRIVATDHRGWGQSEAPSDGYGIADMAADAQGVIDALTLERYVLIGHSMGGKVAQLIASHRPAGLAGLVLVAPSPPTPMLLSDAERATLAGAYQTRESVEFVIDHVLTAKRLDVAQREQVIEDSLKGAPQAKAGWPNVALREDISSESAAIVAPTIVISGELDQVDRIETLEAELLPRVPHAVLRIVPSTGHLSPLESPVEVASIIEEFADALVNKHSSVSRLKRYQRPSTRR
ncbi:alpha/beta hydrolase [Caballeronia fortuita]|uniref:Alpha/beta hydrolase n=1 Tax=Caballeronia fortuita TaxID=1777138 RepID=A0A158AGN0_9BURK|nr:alpha/beta hydrolase [Caballeronia fortuita]SAK56938.1 alpha/beta hydrolase [Caballeronia fortuita]